MILTVRFAFHRLSAVSIANAFRPRGTKILMTLYLVLLSGNCYHKTHYNGGVTFFHRDFSFDPYAVS